MHGKRYKRKSLPSWIQQLIVATVATLLGGLLEDLIFRFLLD